MTSGSIIVTLNLFCLLVACKSQFFPKPAKTDTDIQPVDALVFVGETLKLQCNLTNTALQVSPEDMYFEMTFHYKNIIWTIPQNATVVGNKTISAFITITENYPNTTTVCCKYRSMTKINKAKCVYIYAEKPIQNITNFTGVYYYNKEMELSWSLGESYLGADNINVTVDWSGLVPPNKQGNDCAVQTKESCILRPTGQDTIFMRINVSHIEKRPSAEFLEEPLYSATAVSVIEIHPYDDMKTQPPRNLHVLGKNSTCVNLAWDPPLYFQSCKRCRQLYEVTRAENEVTIAEKDDRPSVITESGIKVAEQNDITICSLSPFTAYLFSVAIKAKEINPWSEPAIVAVTTNEARPLTGPPLTPTSYHSDDCVENQEDVTVYWNDPLKSSLQGELTKFEVVVGNVTALLRRGSNYYKTKLDCDAEHHVLIYSATAPGTSLTPSDITIPRKSAELPAVDDVMVKIEEANDSLDKGKSINVTVAWDAGHLVERNVTLVLYMCQDNSIPNTCFDDFRVRETKVEKRTMLLNNLQATVSLFGYALKDDQGRKRSIQWINCVYRPEQLPGRPSHVNVNVGKVANTLEISWTSARCDKATKVLILLYHLFICSKQVDQIKDIQLCPNATVSSKESSYIATDLQPGNNYYVYMQAESPAGLGPPSSSASVFLGVSNSKSGHTIDVIMGTLSAITFASFLVFCCARQCKRSKKKVTSLGTQKFGRIFDNVETLQNQTRKESNIGTTWRKTSTSEKPLEKSPVPPALPAKSGIDVTGLILSPPTTTVDTSNKLVHDTKTGNTEDKIPSTATPIHTHEPQLTCAQGELGDSEIPYLPGTGNRGSHSNSANPYVKMTNECFFSGSDSCTVAVDEGYNSPEFEMESPAFSVGTSQTLLAEITPVSPVCRTVYRNGLIPQQCQDASTCIGHSHVSSPAGKLPEPNFIVNSVNSQTISETHFSMNSQSQTTETNPSIILPQYQISSTASLLPIFPQSLNKLRVTGMSPKPMVTMGSSVTQVYNISIPSKLPIPSLPTQHEFPCAVSIQDINPLQNNKNTPEVKTNLYSGTNILARPQIELCNKNKEMPADSTQVCDNTEHASDLCRDDNSSQQLLSGYVTYTINGAMNFKTMETDSEHESTDSGNIFSHYKPNCQISPNLALPEDSESASAGYTSVEFLENSPVMGSSVPGGCGTHGGNYVDEPGLVSHGGFVADSESYGNKGRLLDCVNNDAGADTDDVYSYVTCAADDKVDSHREHESVASLNRFSDYTPNCQTHMSTKDAFSDYEFGTSVSQSSRCNEIDPASSALANEDSSQGTSAAYKSLHFLEHSSPLDFDNGDVFGMQKKKCTHLNGFKMQKEDCIRQDEFGICPEECGYNGELKMHNENFVKWVRSPIDKNNDDGADEVNGQTSDYVWQNFTEVGKGMLKPVYVGNKTLKQLEILSEQTTSGNSSFEINDWDNTSADTTIDQSVSGGGYVSRCQLATQTRPDDSSSYVVSRCRHQTQNMSQNTEDLDEGSGNSSNDCGYVSVNCMPREVML